MGYRAVLDVAANKKILSCWEWNPTHAAHDILTLLTAQSRFRILFVTSEVAVATRKIKFGDV